METLGSRIKYARSLRKGLTQAAVAKHFEINRVNVSQWESDTTKPESDKFPALARLLGTTTDWLISGRGKGPGSIVASYDPDAPADDSADEPADEMPRPEPFGDVANLDIRGGLGLGSVLVALT